MDTTCILWLCLCTGTPKCVSKHADFVGTQTWTCRIFTLQPHKPEKEFSTLKHQHCPTTLVRYVDLGWNGQKLDMHKMVLQNKIDFANYPLKMTVLHQNILIYPHQKVILGHCSNVAISAKAMALRAPEHMVSPSIPRRTWLLQQLWLVLFLNKSVETQKHRMRLLISTLYDPEISYSKSSCKKWVSW